MSFDVVSVKPDKSVSGMIRVMTRPTVIPQQISLEDAGSGGLQIRGPDFRAKWVDSARAISMRRWRADVDALKKLSLSNAGDAAANAGRR
jgi:hypothetical protein